MEREILAECQQCKGDGLWHGDNPPAPIEFFIDSRGARHEMRLTYCPACMGTGVMRQTIVTPD